MRGLPPKTLPLRVVVHGANSLVEALAHGSDQLVLSQVETNLEISARVSQADVLVVDAVTVPRAFEEVKALQVKKPVLMLVGPGDTRAAFEAGARGVLPAGSSAEAITAALGAVAKGLAVVEPSQLGSAVAPAMPLPQPVTDVVLTQREMQVLTRMADGLSNKQIAADLGVSEHTAKFHVNSILQKFHAQKRVEAVVQAAKRGLIQLGH